MTLTKTGKFLISLYHFFNRLLITTVPNELAVGPTRAQFITEYNYFLTSPLDTLLEESS